MTTLPVLPLVLKNIAKFEVLGIEAPLRLLQVYEDHGFVDDLPGWVLDVSSRDSFIKLEKMLLKTLNPQAYEDKQRIRRESYKGLLGATVTPKIEVDFLRVEEVHIAYIDQGSDLLNTKIRGHEETHALEKLGKISLLEEKIAKYGVKLGDSDDEEVAEIGSVYGLLRTGYPLNAIMLMFGQNQRFLRCAELYR